MANELIVTKNKEVSASFKKKYIKMKALQDRVNAEVEKMNNSLRKALKDNNIYKLQTEDFSVCLSPDGTSLKFDAKKFKKDNPKLYDKYLKPSATKGKLTVTIKDVKNDN